LVAIFGGNGAGKTTSIRAVTGFLRAEKARVISGSIKIFDQEVANWETDRTSRLGVALVPERRKVFPRLTVSENLAAVGNLPDRKRRAEVLAKVIDLFPILAERRYQLAGGLSGGQQQMLAIGSALMSEPRLLVIDEVTLGLHFSVHEALYRVIRHVADSGTTVLVVDESAGVALDVSDYCYILSGGTVVDEGPPDRFRGNELLAAGYVG
jgi:branched-chain amino acid transport system ATP-binding protein